MQHTWGSKEHHRLVCLQGALVVRAHMREVEHILLDEGLLNLLISPVYEKFVVKICLFSKSARKIDWVS
jgi:hypothetical protein